MLRRLLSTFSRISGVQAATIFSAEGQEVGTFLDLSLKGVQLTSPSKETLREAGRIAGEAKLGEVDQIWIESSSGNTILAPLSGGNTLLVSSKDAQNIGRLRHEVRVRTPVIEDLLR